MYKSSDSALTTRPMQPDTVKSLQLCVHGRHSPEGLKKTKQKKQQPKLILIKENTKTRLMDALK